MTDKPKSTPKLPNFGQLVKSLKTRVERIEQDLKAIRDSINTKDNWHAEIKDWIGKKVHVQMRSRCRTGQLLWTDRYNICILSEGDRIICTKGGIDSIRRSVDE